MNLSKCGRSVGLENEDGHSVVLHRLCHGTDYTWYYFIYNLMDQLYVLSILGLHYSPEILNCTHCRLDQQGPLASKKKTFDLISITSKSEVHFNCRLVKTDSMASHFELAAATQFRPRMWVWDTADLGAEGRNAQGDLAFQTVHSPLVMCKSNQGCCLQFIHSQTPCASKTLF